MAVTAHPSRLRVGNPDYLIMASVGALVVLGCIAVYSSSFALGILEFGDANYFVFRQVFFGADGALLEAAVEAQAATVAQEDRPQTVRVATLAEAVQAARTMADSGDVVLLSPACTSFDAYPNFEERGVDFRRLVAQLSQEANP